MACLLRASCGGRRVHKQQVTTKVEPSRIGFEAGDPLVLGHTYSIL